MARGDALRRAATIVLGAASLLVASTSCQKQILEKEATQGLAHDPYPTAPRNLAPSLTILVWPATILEENQRSFESHYGVKLVIDNFANDDDAYHRLVSQPGKYDLVMVSQYMADRMRREGLLAKVPRLNEGIYHFIDTSLLNPKADPRMEYFIPFDYAVMGVSFNIEHLAGFPRQWRFLSEHKNNPYLYGRIVMEDDMRYAMAIAMLYAGIDPANATPKDIAAARDLLIWTVREYGLRFLPETETDYEMVHSQALLAITWSGEAAAILRGKPSCRFLIPEGKAIMTLDGFSIPKTAPAPRTAALFIEFMLHPYSSLLVANESNYASTNRRTMKHVDRFMINGPSCMLPAPEDRIHMKYLEGEELKLYQEAWAEVKKARYDPNKVNLLPAD